MFTKKRIFNFMILFVVVSFVLVGCVRPFSGEGEVVAEATADPNEGGGVSQPVEEGSGEQPETETQPETEAETESETEAETAVTEETTTATSEPETAVEAQPTETTTTETTETTTTTTETNTQTTQESTTPAQTNPVAPVSATCPVTHTVQSGENLYRIGLQYGMSWVPIAQANGLANPNAIYAGQVLVIPVAGCAPVPPNPQPPIYGTTYVVQPGDNLYQIGLKFGISWVQIAEANGIVNPNQIYVGQVLKIPVAQPGPTPNFTHLVLPGETLYSISIHYGVPWQAIATANQIPPPYVVYAGQTIIIPGTW